MQFSEDLTDMLDFLDDDAREYGLFSLTRWSPILFDDFTVESNVIDKWSPNDFDILNEALMRQHKIHEKRKSR